MATPGGISGGGLEQALEAQRRAVEARLATLAERAGTAPPALAGAVRHGLTSPGKRFRPLLALAAAWQFGGEAETALDPACAVELVHAASLILDDLPSMDDAGLRRGRETTHRAYGEGAAILAAVGLLNEAFALVAAAPGLDDGGRVRLAASLGTAVGFAGLVCGQALDLFDRDRARGPAELERLNHCKTGALVIAAVEAGAICAGVDEAGLAGARRYGRELGLAFQVRDDLLDLATAAETGKDAGQDRGMDTVASTLGRAEAERRVEGHVRAALDALGPEGAGGPLARFARLSFPEQRVAA